MHDGMCHLEFGVVGLAVDFRVGVWCRRRSEATSASNDPILSWECRTGLECWECA